MISDDDLEAFGYYKEEEEAGKKDWPLYSLYYKQCPVCQEGFAGPKRAPVCWKCASKVMKDWWESTAKIGK